MPLATADGVHVEAALAAAYAVLLLLAGSVLPLLWLCWLGVRYRLSLTTREEPQDVLFTEVTEPAGAR